MLGKPSSKMYSYSTTRITVFILLQLKGIFSSQELCLENDITKHVDEWVTSIFRIDVENAVELISAMNDYKVKEFESTSKFFFQNINFQIKEESESDELEPPQIHWKLPESEVNVFFEELCIRIWGTICVVKDEAFTDFNTSLYIENFTFIAQGIHKDGNLEEYNTMYSGSWHRLADDTDVHWTNEHLTEADKEQITREIKPVFPAMLHENMNNNPDVPMNLDGIFQAYEKPRKKLISKHPYFLNNPQQYYYLIPKIPFYSFILKRVAIHGLSNLESFKVHRTSGIFTHTLLIRNVQGRMILDYRSRNERSLKLSFQIDCLFVSKKDDIDYVHAQAKYYTVTRTKGNITLNARQSEVIMNGLESAIASSLLPSMEVGKVCDLETPLDKIKISNASDWKTIKQSYKGWIPFNDDRVNNK